MLNFPKLKPETSHPNPFTPTPKLKPHPQKTSNPYPNIENVPYLPVPFLLDTTHNTSVKEKISNHPSLLSCEPTQ